MTVEEKIGVLVERYCRNRSHLADMIGVTPQAVNNWVYRDHITRRGIEAIMARFPEVDQEWLRGASVPMSDGSMPLPDEEEEDDDALPKKNSFRTQHQQAGHRLSSCRASSLRSATFLNPMQRKD